MQAISREENVMSQNNGSGKRSEKGLLTQDNCVVALVDHQPQMLFGTSYPDRQSIVNYTVALAKAPRVLMWPACLRRVRRRASAEIFGRRSTRSSPGRRRSSGRP